MGTRLNKRRALRRYRKAAELGHAKAQFRLGMIYSEGLAVDVDSAQAVSWLEKSADQGLPNAQFLLAGFYSRGEGVEPDPAQAYKWLSLAADGELEGLAEQLAAFEQSLAAEDVKRGQALAARWRAAHPKP